MLIDTWSKGRWTNLKQVVWWIALLSQSSSAIWAAPLTSDKETGSAVTDIPQSTSTHLSCGGEYWVENKAKVISIPKSNGSTPVKCRWLLKAKDKHHTISLAAIDAALNLERPGLSVKLEARDGWTEFSPLLGSVQVSTGAYIDDLNLTFDGSFFESIKTTSGFLLLTFQNQGYDPLLMDFVYYTCGGTFSSLASIASPVFDDISPDLRPRIIDCEWHLQKPQNSFYGYLKPVVVNVTDCSSLQMCSNSSMRVLEHVAINLFGKRKENWTRPELFFNVTNAKIPPNESESAMKANYSCSAPGSNAFMEPICGDSVRLIAFDSDVAILRYISYDAGVGFKAIYDTFKVPHHLDFAPNRLPWYLNYCAVTIFTPIGMLIGAAIILYQTRRRGPIDSPNIVRNKVLTARFRERSASVRSDRPFRVRHSFEKPPANRSKSLTNMKLFSTSPVPSNNNNVSFDKSVKVIDIAKNSLLQTVPKSDATETNRLSEHSETESGERRLSQPADVLATAKKDFRPNPSKKGKKDRKVRFSTISLLSDGTQTL